MDFNRTTVDRVYDQHQTQQRQKEGIASGTFDKCGVWDKGVHREAGQPQGIAPTINNRL